MSVKINDVLKITVQGATTLTATFQNVYHCIWTAPDDADEPDVIAAVGEWCEDWLADLTDLLTTTTHFDQVMIYNETQDQPVGTYAPVIAAGTVATDPLPSGVAFLVSLYTGFKRTIGKKFIAGFPEAATTLGEWGPATLGAVAVLATYWIGPQNPSVGYSFTMCTFKKTLLLKVAHAISGGIVRATPAYQRRRKIGVGM